MYKINCKICRGRTPGRPEKQDKHQKKKSSYFLSKNVDKENMFVYYISVVKNNCSFGGAIMRIKNMKRFILSLTILFLLISFLCSMICSKVFSYTELEYKEIIVSEGDTLWSIASNLKGNVNENIYEIKKINNLKDSYIYVGQELLIPEK